jgi:hypothetical protein
MTIYLFYKHLKSCHVTITNTRNKLLNDFCMPANKHQCVEEIIQHGHAIYMSGVFHEGNFVFAAQY